MPSRMRRLPRSNSSTCALTVCPVCRTSFGCSRRFSRVMSPTWIMPSTAAAEIDKRAEVGHVRDRAFDDSCRPGTSSRLLPTDRRAPASDPREIRLSAGLTPSTTTSTASPTATTSLGLRIFFDQDISETWTSPSTPGARFTNAPKSVKRATVPCTRSPTLKFCDADRPRIRLQLLHAERNLAVLGIDLQDFYFDLIAGLQQVGGLIHARPRHVSDMQADHQCRRCRRRRRNPSASSRCRE